MMDVSARFLALTLRGAGWVLWLLIALSVVSLAIMLERLWYLRAHRIERAALAKEVRALLSESASARAPTETELAAAVDGAKGRERLRLERNLAFLATLGSNGPFIGLFGTVLGIIKAFHDLAGSQAGGASTVMAGISEALVTTAVGLMVAIPAVVAFNYFSRRVRVRMTEVDWVVHLAAEDVAGSWSSAPSAAAFRKGA
jgi:biopolymer transport protein ExbB